MFALIALVVAPVSLPTDGWIGFEQPAVHGTQRLGCMRDGKTSLSDDRNRWMSFSADRLEMDDDNFIREFDRFDVFVKYENGIVQQVRAYTPDCDVAGSDKARRVDTNAADGVALLGAVIDKSLEGDVAVHAMATIAHIAHGAADAVLEKYADALQYEDASHNALFWLAQRRGDHGRQVVAAHTGARWPLEHRKQAVMSLALCGHPEAVDAVRSIARTADEAELRAHAVTALGITNAPGVVADLHSIFLADSDNAVRTQAIFGLAQQESAQAAETLLAIIRDPRHEQHRRDALFWLASMNGSAAQEAMDELMAEMF